jgi:hypothetical protein
MNNQLHKAQVEKEQFQILIIWFTVLEHWRAPSRIRRSKVLRWCSKLDSGMRSFVKSAPVT